MPVVLLGIASSHPEATHLCILRALPRGKQHLTDATFCREIAQRMLPHFMKPPEQHPTAAVLP